MPPIVDHINIVVSDLVASVRFYTELLGFELTKEARLEGAWIEAIVGLQGVVAEVAYVQPAGGGPRIELLQYRSPAAPPGDPLPLANAPGLRHVAFRVPDIDALYSRLSEAGVRFFGPPAAVPGDAVRHDEGRKRLCYLRDPDGVILELAQYDADGGDS